MHDLGTLGGAYSQGESINANGQIVGYSGIAGTATAHAFVTVGGVMTDLNTLLPANSGWVVNKAYGINDNGWITGDGTINGQTHAFLLKTAVPAPPAALVFLAGSVLAGWRLRRRART